MAKLKYGIAVADMRGKVGATVYSKNKFGAYARSYKATLTSNTTAQQSVKNKLKSLSQSWKGLTVAQRFAWNQAVGQYIHTNVFGDQVKPTGFDLYVKLNTNLLQVGATAITAPPVPQKNFTLTSASVAINITGSTVVVTFAVTPVPSNFAIVVFATACISSGINYFKNLFYQIAVIDAGTASPVSLTSAYAAKSFPLTAKGQLGVNMITYSTTVALSLVCVNKTTGQKSTPFYCSTSTTGLDAATIALLASMSVQPSVTEINAINTLIVGLKADGIWTKFDLFHCYAQGTQQAANLNWINPANYTAVAHNSATWTAHQGYTGNSSNMYVDTVYVPSTNGVQYTQNDAHIGFYYRVISGIGSVILGCSDVANGSMQAYIARGGGGADIQANLNAISPSPNVQDTSSATLSTVVITRTGGVIKVYRRGSNTVTSSVTATVVPTVSSFLLAKNNGGTANLFTSPQISFYFAGANLTSTDNSNLQTLLNAFMTVFGTNV